MNNENTWVLQLEELKQIATLWKNFRIGNMGDYGSQAVELLKLQGKYHAALAPDVVLELIRQVEALKAENTALSESFGALGIERDELRAALTTKPEVSAVDVELPKFDADSVGPNPRMCDYEEYTKDYARQAVAADRTKQAGQSEAVPQAWTNLLAYVLQDDMHNRLTPRIVDIAYTAFMLAKQPNTEDGGASDWFNDTKPKIAELIAKLRKDLIEELPAQPSPVAQPVQVNAVVTEVEVCAALRTHSNAYKGTPDSTWGAEAKMFMRLVLENFLKSRAQSAQLSQPQDYEEVLADHRRLVRELDVLLNGEDGAAKQASLCDIVSQVRQRHTAAQGEPEKCKRCGGVGHVDDGWLTHSEGGVEYSEPIKCVKDCPVCKAAETLKTNAQMRAEWVAAGGSIHGPKVETVVMPEAIYFEFRRAIAHPQDIEPSPSAKVWCEYVAGMVTTWIQAQGVPADVERCTKAIAGIIERRMWALPVPAQPAPSTAVPPGIYYVSPSGKFIPHHCAEPAQGERGELIAKLRESAKRDIRARVDLLLEAAAMLEAKPVPLSVLEQVSAEYNEWIRFHAAGGDYDEFLRKKLGCNRCKEYRDATGERVIPLCKCKMERASGITAQGEQQEQKGGV